MVLQLRLEIRQTQKLIITPQLRQAIKLLQLSAIDLQAYIENEIKENPLLTVETQEQSNTLEDSISHHNQTDSHGTTALKTEAQDWESEPGTYEDGVPVVTANEQTPDTNYNYEANLPYSTSQAHSDDYDPFQGLSSKPSLGDHLRDQAQLAFFSTQDKFVADYLIDLVEPDGYIRASLPEVASALDFDLSDVERILSVLQTFDPIGICARSLVECLTLQLKDKNRFDPYIERFLTHLDLLAACDYPRLKKLCGVGDDDLEDMISEIRQLNPRPGAAFETSTIEMLIADVIVKSGKDGIWKVELNPNAAPVLAVDRAYYLSLKSRCRSDQDRAYLSDRFGSANWLAKSLEQRLDTILKVASAIVEEQSDFLDYGVRHLKPLSLRHIAEKIGMHESTVSRVTSNKAMATPRGLLEMKYFFTSAIATTSTMNGHAHSSESVRHILVDVISKENKNDVLSDDKIVILLKEQGIDIARRTVAKYREALGIPSSAVRRRQKRVPRRATLDANATASPFA